MKLFVIFSVLIAGFLAPLAALPAAEVATDGVVKGDGEYFSSIYFGFPV